MTLLLTLVLMGQCPNGQCAVPTQLEYRVMATATCSTGTCSAAASQQQVQYSMTYTEQGVVPQERRGFFKKLFKRRNR